MSSTQTDVTNITGAITPSSFLIKKALLYPSNKTKPVDIRDMILKMDVEESLSNPFIILEAFVQDGGNYFSRLRLNGNEKVEIIIGRRKQADSESLDEDQKWEMTLTLVDVFQYSRMSANKQYYTLRMVSPWVVADASKLIVNEFEGTMAGAIEKILRNNLSIERIEKINTSSKGSVQGVFPTISPLKAASWLLNNCYEESTPFFLYETCKKGVYLDSLKSMYDKDVQEIYELKSFFSNTPGSAEYFDEIRTRIIKFSSPINYSQFSNIKKGVYGSKFEAIDIFNKQFIENDYRYSDNTKLNKFQPFSNNDKVSGLNLNQITEGRTFHVNLNPGAFEQGNIHQPLDNTIMKGEAYYNAMSTNVMKMQILGNFGLEVGNKIRVDISKASSAAALDESNMFDKYLGGDYLIQKIESNFEQKFIQSVTLVRDSVGVDIDSKDPIEADRNE